MVQHIKYSGNKSTTKIVKERVIEKQTDNKALLQSAKEMAKTMAKEMAKELAKEIIANMPAQQLIEIRKEGSGGAKDDLIAIDESVVDVTKEGSFKKNFESLGQEKTSEDDGETKRNKLKELLKKNKQE
jgi:hypothetical protein